MSTNPQTAGYQATITYPSDTELIITREFQARASSSGRQPPDRSTSAAGTAPARGASPCATSTSGSAAAGTT